MTATSVEKPADSDAPAGVGRVVRVTGPVVDVEFPRDRRVDGERAVDVGHGVARELDVEHRPDHAGDPAVDDLLLFGGGSHWFLTHWC